MESTEHTDVLIIGAGQSGLALGYHLQRRGRQALRPGARVAVQLEDEPAALLQA